MKRSTIALVGLLVLVVGLYVILGGCAKPEPAPGEETGPAVTPAKPGPMAPAAKPEATKPGEATKPAEETKPGPMAPSGPKAPKGPMKPSGPMKPAGPGAPPPPPPPPAGK